MTQPKKLWSVYCVERQTYDDGVDSKRQWCIGTTYAVSEAQAINNVKHRLGITNVDLNEDGMYGYERVTTFYAKELKQ